MICLHWGWGLGNRWGVWRWGRGASTAEASLLSKWPLGTADDPRCFARAQTPTPPTMASISSQSRQAYRFSLLPYKGPEPPPRPQNLRVLFQLTLLLRAAALGFPGTEADPHLKSTESGKATQLDGAAGRTQKHRPGGSAAGDPVPPQDSHFLLLEPANMTRQRDRGLRCHHEGSRPADLWRGAYPGWPGGIHLIARVLQGRKRRSRRQGPGVFLWPGLDLLLPAWKSEEGKCRQYPEVERQGTRLPGQPQRGRQPH